MNSRIFLLAAVAVPMLYAAPAAAQDAGDGHGTQIYGGLFVGDRAGHGQTFAGATVAGLPRVINTPTKDGIFGGGVIGVIVADKPWGRLRAEGELAASRNVVDHLSLNGVDRELREGRKSVTTTMLNLAYDTPKLFNRIRFTGGVGAGIANIDYEVQYNVSAAGPQIAIPTNTGGRFALQGIAGASFELTHRFELTSDVRFLRVGNHEVERFNQTAGTLDSVLDTKYNATSFTGGIRYKF